MYPRGLEKTLVKGRRRREPHSESLFSRTRPPELAEIETSTGPPTGQVLGGQGAGGQLQRFQGGTICDSAQSPTGPGLADEVTVRPQCNVTVTQPPWLLAQG